MVNKNSLTILVPAYNEEQTLTIVVLNVVSIANKHLDDYEIIIINDASSDSTGVIADGLAISNPKIKVVHNNRNMNLGYNFQKGLELAQMDYFCMIPADDDILQNSLENIIESTGKADIVLAYTVNYEARHPLRRIVSKMFVRLINFLFNLRVRYYNGPAVLRTELLRRVRVSTAGFAYMAEIVVILLSKKEYSYIEIPMILKIERKGSNFRVFRPRNVWSVFKTIGRLWWHIRVRRASLMTI